MFDFEIIIRLFSKSKKPLHIFEAEYFLLGTDKHSNKINRRPSRLGSLQHHVKATRDLKITFSYQMLVISHQMRTRACSKANPQLFHFSGLISAFTS